MNWKSRVLSTLRPRRFRRSPATAGRQRTSRWRPRTAEEVDKIYSDGIDTIRKWLREKQSTYAPGSANHELCEKLLDLPPEKLIEEVWKDTYPNPERVGCPPYRILMEFGTRRRDLDDPWYEHILHCYPCAMELRPLVRAYMPPDPS